MSTPLVVPHVTVTVDTVPVQPTGGSVALGALNVPYASATVTLPLTPDTALDDLDPREDTRVIINGANTGHWVEIPTGYGYGGYGHGPYGHIQGDRR